MKISKNLLLFGLILLFQSCTGQKTPKQEFHSKDFNWTITIPENFEKVSSADWAKMQNKGAEAVEETFDEEVVNQSTIIFVFKSDQTNYFESNYQPFDPATDGDYLEMCKVVDELMYETFMAQIPGVKIDTTRTVETIDNLEFETLLMKIEYPNKMIMHMYMFSRLFDKRDFSVNIMFLDNVKGEKMLNAWRESKFGK